MRSTNPRGLARTARGVFPIWLPLLLAAGCRFGYDVLSLDGSPSGQSGGTGGAAGDASAGTAELTAGEAGAPFEPAGGRGMGGSSGSMSGGSGAGTSGSTSDSGAPGTGGGAAGDDSGGTSAGGSSSGASGSSSSGASGASASSGAAGTSAGGSAGGSSGATSGGSGGSAGGSSGTTSGGSGGSGGSAGSGPIPDLADGYWVLDGSDSSGKSWTTSTLVFSSATSNSDGTVALTYRIDWFENEVGFGILLAGEEFGAGTFDPATNQIALDQTGGFAPDPLDHYEVTYDPTTGALVNGFWNTGSPGTFTGVHELSGLLLSSLQATATSMRGTLTPSNAVDTDMKTYWSSANGSTIGEVLTVTLSTPARLSGIRLLAVSNSTEAAPSRLTVRALDGSGANLATTDLLVSTDPMWKPMSLVVNSPVSRVELEVVEILPSNGNRVVVGSVELFGLP